MKKDHSPTTYLQTISVDTNTMQF